MSGKSTVYYRTKSRKFVSSLMLSAATAALFGGVTVHAAENNDAVFLEEIIVSADRRASFSADYVQAGTFRNARLIDTPLTATVLTRELLDAQQALNITDAVRNTAGVTTSEINTVIYSNIAIRGIAVGNVGNYRLNGVLPIVNYIHMPLENKSRVEVLKGASGLYYGFASPSGVVNLVTKRPTENGIGGSISGNSHAGYGASIDFTQMWGESGIRVNAGGENTEFGVDKTSGDRFFIAGAYDWNPSEKFSLEVDAEYIENTVTETTLVRLNAPVNGELNLLPLLKSSENLGAEWLKAEGKELNLMAKASYKFTPAVTASVAAGRSYLDRLRRFSWFLNYDPNTGDGTVDVYTYPDNTYESIIYRADLAAAFKTGPIKHELIVGISQSTIDIVTPSGVLQGRVTQNYFNPVTDIPVQATPDLIIRDEPHTRDRGYFVTDRMQFTDWFEATVGYRLTEYKNTTNTTSYKSSPGTVSGSVLFKPMENMSLYGTYIEGLEEGGVAPGIANNPGVLLPAAVSKQYEAGIKFEPRDGLLLTAAYFDISRTSSYLNENNFFVQDGKATYRGVEFNASGEITSELSVSASGAYIDAKQASGTAAIVGKRIQNTPKYTGSLFLEYKVSAVPGLRLSGGMFHTGNRAVNVTNDAYIPSYTLFDVGATYEVDWQGRPISFRLYGHNITGKRYWEATGSGLLAQGKPSIVKFSVSTTY